MNTKAPRVKAVLFDLDGTLLDTAADFEYIIHELARQLERPVQDYGDIRHLITEGSYAMLNASFGEVFRKNSQEYLEHFFKLYAANIDRNTRPYPGILEVLATLKKMNLPWGVVTNKLSWLRELVIEKMAFSPPPQCIVSGDTLSKSKPDPEPLFYAASKLNVPSKDCIYLGDAEIDIIAGKKAGMITLIAQYGYIKPNADPATWEATGIIKQPLDLLHWITP